MPFKRLDYKHWSYWKGIFTHFLFIPRFLVGWSIFFFVSALAIGMCLGQDPKNLPLWRKTVIIRTGQVSSFLICLLTGILPWRKRVDADYSKYLGSDWKKTYDGAGIHIS